MTGSDSTHGGIGDAARGRGDRSLHRRTLANAGFAVRRDGHALHVDGAGAGLDDHSIDLAIECADIDGVKVVRLSSILRSEPGSFEAASLAATRVNGAGTIPTFEVVELDGSVRDGLALFRVRASFALYADHLSTDEFGRMTWLYLKEVDAVDNELAEIIGSGASILDRSTLP